MNDDTDYENYITNKKRPVCKIFDCYYEYEYFNNFQPTTHKNCHLCAYDYEKLQRLSNQIREEVVMTKNNHNQLMLKARIVKGIMIAIGYLVILYSLAFLYFKIKH